MSTLRRRIKSNKIRYKLEDGKYLISDSADESAVRGQGAEAFPEDHSASDAIATPDSGYSMSRLLLDELKRAYLDSLQGKEDQILYLKQQVSDLKTLVMFLEKENNRLKHKGI
ncbi:MAG: hypothetical protein K2Q26_01445 [Bdellovibrionales bacterium]|nr:hypothetical protein [Bdellovibrionales bacterium]